MSGKLILLFLFTIFTFKLIASEELYNSSEEQATLETVIQLINGTHEDNGKGVWSKYDLSTSPIIISFTNGHVYAFNLQTNDPSWEPITIDQTDLLFSPVDKWGFTRTLFQPSFRIDNQSAYVFNLSTSNGKVPFHAFVHERFHRFQFKNFNMEDSKGNWKEDNDIDHLTLMEMEEQTLVNFMKAEGDLPSQKEYLKDFAAINQIRQSMMDPSSKEWENHQQRMEGTAEYVSYKMFEQYPLPDYSSHQALLQSIQNAANNLDVSDRAVKWRHYSVGAVLGYGLDALGAQGWKQQVENGKSQAQVLIGYFNMSPEEIKSRMDHIKASYDYIGMRDKIENSATEYQRSVFMVMNSYDGMNGIPVILNTPRNVGISGSGSTAKIYHMLNGLTVNVKDSSVMTTTDNAWRLELLKVPIVFQIAATTREFKADNDTLIQLDDKEYNLADILHQKESMTFTKLNWKNKNSIFNSINHIGTISTINNRIVINYQ